MTYKNILKTNHEYKNINIDNPNFIKFPCYHLSDFLNICNNNFNVIIINSDKCDDLGNLKYNFSINLDKSLFNAINIFFTN